MNIAEQTCLEPFDFASGLRLEAWLQGRHVAGARTSRRPGIRTRQRETSIS